MRTSVFLLHYRLSISLFSNAFCDFGEREREREREILEQSWDGLFFQILFEEGGWRNCKQLVDAKRSVLFKKAPKPNPHYLV